MGGSGDHRDDADGIDDHWQEFFGFDTPYANQADAIRTAIRTGRHNGYLAMEGPCGTGKTMAALTAATYLTRRTDKFDNVVVVTPVKQQLHQFVEDLRRINSAIDDPFRGVALVGKADLCPYEREGVFPDAGSVNTRCSDLRETTADAVETHDTRTGYSTPSSTDSPSVAIPAANSTDDEPWWDPERARHLTTEAAVDNPSTDIPGERLTTAGAESPYQRAQPTIPDDLDQESENPSLYCPFEADWYARDKGSPVGFEAGDDHVITIDEYLPTAVSNGTCPHRVMGVLLEAADIVIGNYNHLFDPQTRSLTESVLSDRTFVIVDEAHRLEERVRDLLSDGIGRHTIRRAHGDLRFLTRHVTNNPDRRAPVREKLAKFNVSLHDVETGIEFYSDLVEWLHEYIDSYLETTDTTPGETGDIEIPLRDPDSPGIDDLTAWARTHGYTGGIGSQLSTIGKAVEQTLRTIDPDRNCVCTAVGALLEAWWDRSHSTYFREILLRHNPPEDAGLGADWDRVFTPRLVLYNCMPARQLATIFDGLGGGILMSATLDPMDVFKDVTGLTELADPPNADGRPVTDRIYELPFPPANRASWIVDATPFTASNRGSPEVSNRNDVREEYAQILREIATSPGNVMVCLPNYREALWAGDRLRSEIDKPVLIDESSGVEQTDELKSSFFSGTGKVLVTSTRGTLTEGIDYQGDKLHTCAVVGVPIVNIGSPRVQAVKHAYAESFGADQAFAYSLAIPAVRRARQALGRVIRGPNERGVRILVGNRYTANARYGSVYRYLPESERGEFTRMTPMFLRSQFDEFWSDS